MDPAMLYLPSSIRPGPVAAQPSTGFWNASGRRRRLLEGGTRRYLIVIAVCIPVGWDW